MTVPADGMTADACSAIAELMELRGREITLIPATGQAVEKPGGGSDYSAATPRDTQTFALFQVSSAKTGRVGKGFDSAGAGSDGSAVRRFTYDMIGAAGSIVAEGDSWEDDLAEYTVASVDYSAPYQVGAVVVAYLKNVGHGVG